jgi:hypothetical protein
MYTNELIMSFMNFLVAYLQSFVVSIELDFYFVVVVDAAK